LGYGACLPLALILALLAAAPMLEDLALSGRRSP
jgi:hypothetical protein